MSLLSTAYAAVAAARRRSYERHPERRFRLSQPVISVGNISVGGSGKTPAVAHIARLLLQAGERPAVLSRGYRRHQPTEGVLVVSDGARLCADVERAGDEPLMLARALPGVGVFVGADRFRSGLVAETAFGCTVHILDDGFQHVRLARDVDIVLVRSEDLRDRVLPAGRLRESLDALSRADAIVMHEADDQAEGVRRQANNGPPPDTRLPPLGDASAARFVANSSIRIADFLRAPADGRSPDSVFAVAGIARPRRFFDALVAAGLHVAGEMTFRDHQWFTPSHLNRIVRAARQSGASRIVTTEKDFVRLLPLRPFPMPIEAVPLSFAIEPATEFNAWLLGKLAAARARAGATAAASDPVTTRSGSGGVRPALRLAGARSGQPAGACRAWGSPSFAGWLEAGA